MFQVSTPVNLEEVKLSFVFVYLDNSLMFMNSANYVMETLKFKSFSFVRQKLEVIDIF